jgi:hypothetical protein
MRITKPQLRTIWMLSHRRNMNESMLRRWVTAVSGQTSLRRLTVAEAAQLIDVLWNPLATMEVLGREAAQHHDLVSHSQQWMINRLAAKLGWNRHQVMGLAQRMYGRLRRESLNQEEASGLIEALKAIRDRQLVARAA